MKTLATNPETSRRHRAGTVQWITILLALAAVTARAQSVSNFIISKGRLYSQISPSAPAPQSAGGFVFAAAAPDDGGAPLVTGGTLTLPGGATPSMTDVNSDAAFEFHAAADNQAALDAAYPPGSYTISLSSTLIASSLLTATIGLPAEAFPSIPQAADFAAAQTIDPTADFVLTYQAFASPGPQDDGYIEIDDAGTAIYTDSLDLTAAAYTIPANTLTTGKSYQALLRFRSVHVDLASFPQPAYAFYNEVHFALSTGSGPVDNTPPTLIAAMPASGGALQDTSQPLLLGFSKAMNPADIAIQWTAMLNGTAMPLDPSAFTFFWSNPSNLICAYGLTSGGWPAGALVSWSLNPVAGNPTNFADLNGNLLAVGVNAGTFLSAGGPWNCAAQASLPLEAPAFYLNSIATYTQDNPIGPTPDPAQGAEVDFYYRQPNGLKQLTGAPSIVAVNIPLTGGTANSARALYVDLTPKFHMIKTSGVLVADYQYYQFRGPLPDPGNLFGAQPSGIYELQLAKLNPTNINSPPIATNGLTVTMTNKNFPTTPRFANYAAAQSFNISNDFRLQWDAYAGTSTNSFISFQIQDTNGITVFRAPDACSGVALTSSATGIVIPANTLIAGQSYDIELAFGSVIAPALTIPGTPGQGYSSIQSVTRMNLEINGNGSAQLPPTVAILGPAANVIVPAGNVAFQVSAADSGAALAKIELFDGTNLLATLPMSANQSNFVGSISGKVAAGPNALTVEATDVNGLTAISDSLTIMGQDPAFVITLASPTSGQSYPPFSTLLVSVTGVSPKGPITNVDFYMDGSWIGNSAAAPFQISVQPGFGAHTLYAEAQDSAGFAGISPPTTVTITTPAPGKLEGGFGVDGAFQAAFTGDTGTSYVLQVATNLAQPIPWMNIQNRSFSQPAAEFFDLQTSHDAMRVYRIVPLASASGLVPSFSVSSSLDSNSGTNGVCDDTGLLTGFVGSNGTSYNLSMAPASLGSLGFAEVDINSVANINGYPFSGKLLAAVELSPAEAPVVPAGVLTLQLTNVLATNGLIAFSYHAPSGELFLVPFKSVSSANGTTVTISVTRLGGYGVAVLENSDLELQSAHPPSNPDDQAAQHAAWAVLQQLGIVVPQIIPITTRELSGNRSNPSGRPEVYSAGQALIQDLNNSVLSFLQSADHSINSDGAIDAASAALASYQMFYQNLTDAGYANNPSFTSLLAQANALAVDTIQNQVNYVISKAEQNDLAAMITLQADGLAGIDAPPWGNAWPPGAKDALRTKIQSELTFTLSFESLVEEQGLYGMVTTDYQANDIGFNIGIPSLVGTLKGSGAAVFHSLTYPPPPGCTPIAPNPSVPNFNIFQFGFSTRKAGNPRGGTAFVSITGVQLAFGIGIPLENYQFTCPDSGVEQALSYWYPRFAIDHKKEFYVYPRHGRAPTPAFYLNTGWSVFRGGIGAEIASYSIQIPSGPNMETTIIKITHTPF